MVVHGWRGRLHEEDLFASHWLAKLYHHLAIREPVDQTRADLYAQLTCDGRRQARMAVPARIVNPLFTLTSGLNIGEADSRAVRSPHLLRSPLVGC
jgi:hypothetical protein